MKVFKSYSDPQHGWLKVPRSLIVKLGIDALVTRFSYQRGEYVYLEEDQDLTLFMRAYKQEYGCDPVIKSTWSNKSSRIRSYESYRKDAV